MIRINLLGQIRPKASRRAPSTVDAGGALPAVFIGAGLVLGALVLGFFYYTWQNQLNKENAEIKRLTAQKTDLEQTKLQVEAFEKQGRPAAACFDDRAVAARPHGRAGTAGHGCQHGVAD